ncbi:MAG: hypothetical protein ACM3PY_12990 [Omnitrophica WOR_2 bacterium]
MSYFLTLPARINILGNPSDANEGDFATISAAVELRAGALVEDSNTLVLQSLHIQPGQAVTGSGEARQLPVDCFQECAPGSFPLPYTGELDLIKGAINQLHRYSPEFRQKYASKGVRISIWSGVPRQSGLGGSSLFVLLTLAGLRAYYQLDPRAHNDYVIAELTQRTEARELNIACGYADRYVPLFGGLAYIDYRGKLWQEKIDQEPYATYEHLVPGPLSRLKVHLPLVAACTGLMHQSGDVHGSMRPRYLEEQANWEKHGGAIPPMVRFMRLAWETAWRGKIALLHGDLVEFGKLMNENHRLVDEMMSYCGFQDGAGWANNLLIRTALENGALGAKLTGAGSGGSVFALAHPGQESRFVKAFEHAAAKAGLTQAFVYRPRIAQKGLIIKKDGPGVD